MTFLDQTNKEQMLKALWNSSLFVESRVWITRNHVTSFQKNYNWFWRDWR